MDIPDPEPVTATWKRDITPDVRVNDDLQERRLFLLILDDSTIQASPRAINTAKDVARMVIDQFAASDLAAVIFTRDNRHAQDFTADRARLRNAVGRFSAGFRDMGLWDAEAQRAVAGQDDGDIAKRKEALANSPAGLALTRHPAEERPAAAGDSGSIAFTRLHQGGKGALAAVPLRVQLIDATDKLVMDRRQDITAAQFTPFSPLP